MERPKRKAVRLPGYDYDTPGYYFITICTKDKEKLLCDIGAGDVFNGPNVHFTGYGSVAQKHLHQMSDFYGDLRMDKYVIMPNHIHLLLHLPEPTDMIAEKPTLKCAKLSKFISTFKRFCNKEYGRDIWQSQSYDHVIRNEKDYQKIWEYIDDNPSKWMDDCYYL